MPSIEEMFSVRNRVFLFTGGAGVLASSLAYELGKLGAKVVLTDIAPLEEKLEEFRKESIEVRAYRMDALNRAEVEEVAKKVVEEWGRVDALFNAAGVI